MKGFITFLTVIALAKASEFYSINDIGPLQYGIGDGSIARQEIRTPDGIIRGTVTYIDGDGKSKTIAYGGDNEPSLPEANVAEEQQDESAQQSQEMNGESVQSMADSENEEKVEEATPNNPTDGDGSTEESSAAANLPQPVQYTPEVAAARAAHFIARDQAIYLQRLASSQKQFINPPQLINHPIFEYPYPPYFRDYYGAAKPFRAVNPFYYL